MASQIKKLASETAIYGLSQMLGKFVNYLLVPIYTRVFLPEEYGVVNLLYGYLAFFNVILTYGMETAFFRFISKKDGDNKVFSTAFISICLSSLLAGLLWIFFKYPIMDWLDYSGEIKIINCFILISIFDALAALPFALLRYYKRPIRFAIIKNTSLFVNIFLNLYFLVLCPYAIKNGWNSLPFYYPNWGVFYIFISNAVSSFIVIPLLWNEIKKISSGFDKELWKEMFKYAFPLLLVGLAGMINETLDRTLVYLYPDSFTGQKMIGIYGANYKLSILMTLFVQAFRYAAEPFFFSHAKSSDKRKIYADVMNYFVVVCCFLFLLVMMNLDLFKLFIGEKYHEGLSVVPILLLANMFLGIYYNLTIWFKLSDKTTWGAYISILGAIITLAVNFIFIPYYGYMASAWATFLCYGSMMLACYFSGQYFYHIPYQFKKILSLIAGSILIWQLHVSATNHLVFYKGITAHVAAILWIIIFLVMALKSEIKNYRNDFN